MNRQTRSQVRRRALAFCSNAISNTLDCADPEFEDPTLQAEFLNQCGRVIDRLDARAVAIDYRPEVLKGQMSIEEVMEDGGEDVPR